MADSIQQQLITARRNQILDSAAVVFAEKGFHPTTIRDIARHAGIADGTIYNYFQSKPALLMGIFERMRLAVIQDVVLPDLNSMGIHVFIRTFLYHPLMALRRDNFALFRIVISEMMVNEELRTLYNEQIMQPTIAAAEMVLQQQSTALNLTPERIGLMVRAISGMILGLMIEYVMGDTVLETQWEQMPDSLTDFVLYGIVGKKG